MSRTDFNTLLEAGAHFGHLKRKWNPKMAPYIFMEKNGIHIIDLHKTVLKIDEAAAAIKQIAKSGRRVLFVATKKQAKDIVAEKVAAVGMPYVTERWAGGMLTNFPTIRKAVKKMSTIDKMATDGTFDNFSKREKPPACETGEDPRLDRRPDASSGGSVRRRRTEGGQRREGGQTPQHPRICNGRHLL